MMMRLVSRTVVALALAFAAACGGDRGNVTDSAHGAAAVARPSAATTPITNHPSPFQGDHAGKLGRIPILEYHVVADSSHGMFVISRDQFRREMGMLYDRGYRPMTVAQLVARDFSAIPPGMSPVVFTFDDASPEQFAYVERNGQLEIDSTSAIGIWMDFASKHADWKGRATFCLLSGAEAGHAFFGDKPQWRGQKNEWRHRKVKWLADNGFELCNHTLWHAQLSKYPDAFVQEQIARGQLAIDSAVPGYKIRTFALPQGLWPRNRALAWKGSWTDPRAGKTISYDHETVLEVSGGPARSPFDPDFDRRKLPRVIAFQNAVKQALDRLDANKTRFVWSDSTQP
jgi:peptidoglycan/xylan/chitin deacetylase (PgdA/CDA1 family)